MEPEIPEIYQGQTADWLLPLNDSEGNPVDLAALIGFAVFLTDVKGKILEKYSKNSINGFENTLTIDGSAINKIRMINEASHTSALEGIIYYQIKVQLTNSDYENNRWTGYTERLPLMKVLVNESNQYTALE